MDSNEKAKDHSTHSLKVKHYTDHRWFRLQDIVSFIHLEPSETSHPICSIYPTMFAILLVSLYQPVAVVLG